MQLPSCRGTAWSGQSPRMLRRGSRTPTVSDRTQNIKLGSSVFLKGVPRAAKDIGESLFCLPPRVQWSDSEVKSGNGDTLMNHMGTFSIFKIINAMCLWLHLCPQPTMAVHPTFWIKTEDQSFGPSGYSPSSAQVHRWWFCLYCLKTFCSAP